MDRLYYCGKCKRVITNEMVCNYCEGDDIRELVIKTPVNVIGTKIKGNILKMKNGKVNLIVRDEFNNKFIKEYSPEQLRKVL